MSTKRLIITTRSEATFGRGDGVAGLIDQEIEHEPDTGLPFISGRRIKGLLVEECANILYGLDGYLRLTAPLNELEEAAALLFGRPGSGPADDGGLRVGRARYPGELHQAIRYAIYDRRTLSGTDVLESLTTIRRQTAVDETSGTPDEGSLRAGRALLRNTSLAAELELDIPAEKEETALALLAACIAAWRRGGTARNRGRGRLVAYLESPKEQKRLLEHFCRLIGVTAP